MLTLSNFGIRLPGGICSSPVAVLQAFNTSDRSNRSTSPASSETSTSSSSVFSVEAASSQSSESSVDSIHVAWATEDPWQGRSRQGDVQDLKIAPSANHVLPTRSHPRRTSGSQAQRPPPALLRQSEKKGQFVDNLVDSATHMVEEIWPLSVPACHRDAASGQGVLPLRTFIQETLRRSRTSFSTLQVALYYLLLIKSHVPKYDFTMEQPEDCPTVRALQCGRRMFLAALILASKYLQDRNYSARAWSKISGLNVCEINNNEMAFLAAVEWKLHIPESIFDRWQIILIKYTSPCLSSFWRKIVRSLSPQLDNLPYPMVDWSERVPVSPATSRPAMPQFSAPVVYVPPSPTSSVPPSVLEPIPTMLPPPPALGRMKPLPTPALTPQSSVSNTPAVGFATPCPRQSAMCSAMSMAQNVSVARTVMDCNIPTRSSSGLEAYHISRRRPSIVSAIDSLASSPDSMISDNTSHWSRSSSISSAASISPPHAGSNNLARLAALRRAGLPPQQEAPRKENDQVVVITSLPLTAEPMSSPEIDRLQVTEPDGSSDVVFDSQKTAPTWWQQEQAGNRKRGRSSIDLTLQQQVRSMLKTELSPRQHARAGISEQEMTDKSPCTAKLAFRSSFGCDLPYREAQSLSMSGVEPRLPVQKQLGRKRACCASREAQSQDNILRFEGGPGMWDGIL